LYRAAARLCARSLRPRCRRHGRNPGLHVPRQVRHNPQHPFDQHDLSAVMHLVLFHPGQHFEAALVGGCQSRGHRDAAEGLTDESSRPHFPPRSRSMAMITVFLCTVRNSLR
jgi:hypothetical protein